jgi:hypothetical protein
VFLTIFLVGPEFWVRMDDIETEGLAKAFASIANSKKSAEHMFEASESPCMPFPSDLNYYLWLIASWLQSLVSLFGLAAWGEYGKRVQAQLKSIPHALSAKYSNAPPKFPFISFQGWCSRLPLERCAKSYPLWIPRGGTKSNTINDTMPLPLATSRTLEMSFIRY